MGWRAFAQRRFTRSSVSSPERVVRSMQVMARSSQAICHSFLTVRRVTSVAARRSTALVLTRTFSTQSRFNEVPWLATRGRPPSTAVAWPEGCATASTIRFPWRSVISILGLVSPLMARLPDFLAAFLTNCEHTTPNEAPRSGPDEPEGEAPECASPGIRIGELAAREETMRPWLWLIFAVLVAGVGRIEAQGIPPIHARALDDSQVVL